VTFYPKLQPAAQVSQETINQIGAYLADTLCQKIGLKVQVVGRPGEAKMNVAITGVAGEKAGLKPCQVIPVELPEDECKLAGSSLGDCFAISNMTKETET